jgi:DNA-binding CsgD family transcriptional regulator
MSGRMVFSALPKNSLRRKDRPLKTRIVDPTEIPSRITTASTAPYGGIRSQVLRKNDRHAVVSAVRAPRGALHARRLSLMKKGGSPLETESVITSITAELRLQMLCLVLEVTSGVPVQPANEDFDVNALSAQVFADIHKLSAQGLSDIKTLSARQMVVLRRICRGHASKAIAFDLGISSKTVESHRARIMKKLHVGSMAELMVRVLLAGIDLAATPSAPP